MTETSVTNALVAATCKLIPVPPVSTRRPVLWYVRTYIWDG